MRSRLDWVAVVRYATRMGEGGSLINLGELSKPATVLIEKISDAIGGIFRPYQIRRVAQAETEAEKIQAVSQIEITALQQRALSRFLIERSEQTAQHRSNYREGAA
jgi:hypothetical protein